MALSARTPTGADTAGHVPEIWSNLTVDAAKKNLVAWDATDHKWTIGKGRGDTINIAVTNHVTASEVVVGTKATAGDIATGTKLQLVMNQWWEKPVDFDTMTDYQSQTDWASKARAEAEYAIRVKIDSTVTALYSPLNSATVKGTDGDKITDELLMDLKEILDENDVPDDGDRFLIIDPSVIRDMLEYDKFIAAAYVQQGAVANGQIGKGHPIYGANIRVTNALTATSGVGAYAVMIHRLALASALQIESPWDELYKELHQHRYQFEALWGVKEIRNDFGVAFYSRKA